jgi:hypothetical protein
VVGFSWPHEVFAAGKLEVPTQGSAAVLPLTFQSSSVLVRLEAVALDASYEVVSQVLIAGEGQKADLVVGGPLETVSPVQSAESAGSAESRVPLAKESEQPDSRQVDVGSGVEMFDDCKTVRSETFFEARGTALAPRLTGQRRALADQVSCAAAPGHFTLCFAAGPADITTLPEWRIEQALQDDVSLPGWDYQADTQKHLAYLKVFFDCRTKNYQPNSLWQTAQVPTKIMNQVQEVHSHMQIFMTKAHRLDDIDERSMFDLEVAQVWLQHASQSRIPHGPLLGWGKMKGHELYRHEWRADEKPFLMARIPGTPYEESLHGKQFSFYYISFFGLRKYLFY